MLDRLDDLTDLFCRVLLFVVGFLILLMMVNVTADVLGRVLFSHPIHGTSELVGNYYMIGLVFLTLPLLEMRNGQIFVDLFYNMMGGNLRRFCLFLGLLLQIAFYAGLGYQSAIDAVEAAAKNEVVEGFYRVIIWPSRFMLPIGFLMAMAISVLRLGQVATNSPRAAFLLATGEVREDH